MACPPCTNDCRQGRDCPGKALPSMLLTTGAMAGPYKRTRPITLPWWVRACRAADAWLLARRGPK